MVAKLWPFKDLHGFWSSLTRRRRLLIAMQTPAWKIFDNPEVVSQESLPQLPSSHDRAENFLDLAGNQNRDLSHDKQVLYLWASSPP